MFLKFRVCVCVCVCVCVYGNKKRGATSQKSSEKKKKNSWKKVSQDMKISPKLELLK